MHGPLLEAIAAEALSKMTEFDMQGLANTAWAFASLQLLHMPLLDSISAAARTRL